MLQVRHYALELELQFPPEFVPHSAPGSLWVKAQLQVENCGAEPIFSLPLLLYRLFEITSLTVDGEVSPLSSRLIGLAGLERHQVNAVTVQLPAPLGPGESCAVVLSYGGVIAGGREVWQYMWDTVSRDYTLLRPDIIWYPEVAAPDLASLRQSSLTHKSFAVSVQVPEGYMAAAPGALTEEKGLSRFVTTTARERFDLAIAPFTRLRNGQAAVYHLPESEAWGASCLGWVAAAIEGLANRLGPRVTGELAIVQIPRGWGSQHTPNLILQEVGRTEGWQEAASLVHEVSHFWTPQPADWPRRFADESLASFLQYVLVGELFGPACAREQRARYEGSLQRIPSAAAARFLDTEINPALHSALWYAKGALALIALQEQLGDERFWSVLRVYTADRSASAAGFVALLRRNAPGPETEAYIALWFGG